MFWTLVPASCLRQFLTIVRVTLVTLNRCLFTNVTVARCADLARREKSTHIVPTRVSCTVGWPHGCHAHNQRYEPITRRDWLGGVGLLRTQADRSTDGQRDDRNLNLNQ